MSTYSTIDIDRKRAIEMVRACRAKKIDPVSELTNEELDRELHEYVYSENYTDIVGLLYNYSIKD